MKQKISNNFDRSLIPLKTHFTKYLIRANALHEMGFKEWVFHPGMLFNSHEKWWDRPGERKTSHEGLDMCLFRDADNKISRLKINTKVPVMFDGVVTKILDDFMGKTIIIEHTFSNNKKSRLCTLYAHVMPHPDIHPGAIVSKGDIIAAIADTAGSRCGILPHLHISVLAISEDISYEELNWENIGTARGIVLMDPLEFIDWQYAVMKVVLSEYL
ncbi:MAG: M23 family metallopeptidase [Nitrospiraceae bacterium]|nr:MAG: M23 family metallopeptidase [Nitrospiraceae bacterium]